MENDYSAKWCRHPLCPVTVLRLTEKRLIDSCYVLNERVGLGFPGRTVRAAIVMETNRKWNKMVIIAKTFRARQLKTLVDGPSSTGWG